MEKDKIVFKGSHPDSLYRVPANNGVAGDRMARLLRVLRWPVALVAVCVALAVFVYFLMPENIDRGLIASNGTYWEPVAASASHSSRGQHNAMKNPDILPHSHGTKTPEIDFYDADNEKVDFISIIDTITEPNQKKLPVEPVFPKHIAPEVQYGNEKADSDKLRTAKALEEAQLSQDSTVKPHITQKPEKPLAVYFKEGNAETTTTTETITRAETINELANYGEKQTTRVVEEAPKRYGFIYKEPFVKVKPLNVKQYLVTEPEVSSEAQEFIGRQPVNVNINFTSGHSNLFGISIEDAEKMRSTTQNSLYNTRVSPTLPTWRDRDDTTTKKYPVNVNYEVPQCRSTRQSICRGVLPYDLAGSPATIAGVEVTSLLPQIEYLVATNCSDRVQHFACALMEPECSPPPYPPKMPCYNLCKAIVESCDGLIPRELTPAFNCGQYSRTSCVDARTPCYPREFACRDQTCVPRDWMCDGSRDCPNGEDEATCVVCDTNEFRNSLGTWPTMHSSVFINLRHTGVKPLVPVITPAPTPFNPEHSKLLGGRNKHSGYTSPGEPFTKTSATTTKDKISLYKCNSGGCVLNSWLCDGYADCPRGEDEVEGCDRHDRLTPGEPGEESAGSAPAPAVRRPNRLPAASRGGDLHRTGEIDSSKELLITSDTSNSFKRNFTRRPSPSRLSPYPRTTVPQTTTQNPEPVPEIIKPRKYEPRNKPESPKTTAKTGTNESQEDINIGDLGFLDDIKKTSKEMSSRSTDERALRMKSMTGRVPPPSVTEAPATKLDMSINKLEKVINGAALLKKAVVEEGVDSPETNSTVTENEEPLEQMTSRPKGSPAGSISAHVSPCPIGELRCVDGRCITLAQLCDGSIDCTDHADEDNCYT